LSSNPGTAKKKKKRKKETKQLARATIIEKVD
jgi:hypothetical protein